MNHRNRVLSSLSHNGYDRLPVRYYGEKEVDKKLMNYFNVNSEIEVKEILGDDFRYVWPDYKGPEPKTHNDGSFEIPWPWRWPAGERYKSVMLNSGMLYDEVSYRPFESISNPDELKKFTFPTVDWLDFSSIKSKCILYSDYAKVAGFGNVINFISGISHSLGIERTLMGLATGDPVLLELMEIKFNFHYEEIKHTLLAASGDIDIVYIGEDLGTQLGPLISLSSFDKYIAPYFTKFFNLVHNYNAKVMMHSCGSVYNFIPRLIELGLDILDVVQVSSKDMNIQELSIKFGNSLCFSGSMDVQGFMVTGKPEDIINEVRLRQKLFPDGGLIIGPSHAIGVDVPIANIVAMYQAAGSLPNDFNNF